MDRRGLEPLGSARGASTRRIPADCPRSLGLAQLDFVE